MQVRILALGLCATLFSSLYAYADPVMYYLSYRGTASYTDASGKIVTKTVTDKNWLQDAANAGGITDLKSLAVVYHIGGNSLGDTIDVVDAKTGQALKTLIGLYFGEAFGRTAITNSTGSLVRRLDYVYTDENSHSLGSALVNKNVVTDKKGNSSMTIQGQVQYIITPLNNIPAQVSSGRFATLKPFVAKGP